MIVACNSRSFSFNGCDLCACATGPKSPLSMRGDKFQEIMPECCTLVVEDVNFMLKYFCNSSVNKDKFNFYRNLVSENAQGSKKLWQVLRSALHSFPKSVLPSRESQKCLADIFVTFF